MANRDQQQQITSAPTPSLNSIVFITEQDERETTIKSLFCLLRQAVHPASGDLEQPERDAIGWTLYVLEQLVEDDRAAKA